LHLAGVDAVDLGETRKQPQRGAAGRPAEGLAFDIFYGLDRPVRLGDEDERRPAVDLIDHHRLLARLLRGLLDDGIDIAEAGIVRAAHDAGDGGGRALPLVDRDVESLGFEITLVARDVVPGVDALELEVEGETDRRERLARGRKRKQGEQAKCRTKGRGPSGNMHDDNL